MVQRWSRNIQVCFKINQYVVVWSLWPFSASSGDQGVAILHPSITLAMLWLEHPILIFLAQIFKQFPGFSQLSLRVRSIEPKILFLVHRELYVFHQDLLCFNVSSLFYFRYVPRASPTKQVFPLSDIRVDLSTSSEKIISLKSLSVQSSGHFMCEVIILNIIYNPQEKGIHFYHNHYWRSVQRGQGSGP